MLLLKEAAGHIPDWVQMRLWLRSHCADLTYQSEGRFDAAPGGRFRLELQTQRGPAVRQLLVLHDGDRLYHSNRSNPESEALVGTSLPSDTFRGPGPLLRSLHDELIWAQKGTVHHGGTECVELNGTWKPERCQAAPGGEPWPAQMPQHCRLLLDRATLWPCRLEWWGPDSAKHGSQLLVELEFRWPVLDRPLSAKESARLFTIPKNPPESGARPTAFTFGTASIDG
jgi:hypothetical protein